MGTTGRGASVDWTTLVATLGGGALALSGTILADVLRHHDEKDRSREANRRSLYIDFVSAVGVCHTRLRQIAEGSETPSNREVSTRAALADAGIYEARERLFIDATSTVAGAGQAMYEQLRALRRVVAAGASISSASFHDAYHPYLDAVWHYRRYVREELGTKALSPDTFGWPSWNGRERCDLCRPSQ
ncbi:MULTISPECIES: CchlQ [unclassified Frankia]|uniref:CchlQ n=1 Tax=unclassified Frankia TaxID=2632575 RepID=UPI002AD417B5|nr:MULTISPECIES: CchlQ [unclassified Frankia]